MDNIFRLVKEAKIDLQYLSSIGFDISKKTGKCPIHNGDNKHSFSYKEGKDGNYIFRCYTEGCTNIDGKEAVDVIGLCMLKENLANRYEATKHLANMFNIDLPIKNKKEFTDEEKAKYFVQKQLKQFKDDKVKHLETIKARAIENKELDKAFTIDTLISELNINTLEFSNYSKYKPTRVYEIDKYTSENKEGFILAINEANEGKKVLIISPTGSGKTDLTIKELKGENINTCFISPNASNVEQIVKEHDIPGAFDVIGAEDTFLNEGVKAFTWDKFQSLKDVDLSNSIAVVDEIHQTFNDMYRSDKIKGLYTNLNKCKGRIDITATPNKLDLELYDVIIEYKQRNKTKYNVKLYTNKNDDKVKEIINKSKKFALLENNTKNLLYYQASTNKNTDVISKKHLHPNKTYTNIIENSTIGDVEGILNTSIIVAGVNIYDKDITDIIIIGEKDISTIKQYVARFRDLEEVNVHIFNQYEDISNTYNLEWLVNQRINDTQRAIDGINYFNKNSLIECNLNLNAIKLEEGNHFYYDKEINEYKLDIPGIRHEVYSKYYLKADIISFRELLKEYFNEIEIVDVKENKNCEDKKEFKQTLKEQEEAILDILENHIDILVGANEILSNKISSKLNNYLIQNNLREEYILEQLNKYNISDLLQNGKIRSIIDLYSKYVLENNFTYEFAWYLCNLGNKKRGKIFSQLNKIVFREIEAKYPQLINNNLVENRLYSLIVNDFKPGISYTKEHLEMFIEAIQIIIPGLKLTVNKLGETIKDIYVVDEINSRGGTQVDTIFYKKVHPTYVPNKRIRVYTIMSFKTVKDISIEHNLSEISCKSLENITKKRLNNIVESSEAREILNVEKIFSSKK